MVNPQDIGGIVHWSESVQHLLTAYATKNAITEIMEYFNDICQMENENETTFVARLNNGAYSCGNVNDEDEEVTIYVKRLFLALTKIVQRFRNANPSSELTMERIVQFACEEGDSYR